MQSTQRDFLWHLLTHLQWLGRVALEQRLWYLRRKTKPRVDIDPTDRQTGQDRSLMKGRHSDTASCFSHLTCQALRSPGPERETERQRETERERDYLCYLSVISSSVSCEVHFSYLISVTSWLDIWQSKLLWKVIRRSQDRILNTSAITFPRTLLSSPHSPQSVYGFIVCRRWWLLNVP